MQCTDPWRLGDTERQVVKRKSLPQSDLGGLFVGNEKRVLTQPLTGGDGVTRKTNYVDEPGLYKLIMRSDKAAARPFQDWVTLRKAGFVDYPTSSEDRTTFALGLSLRPRT